MKTYLNSKTRRDIAYVQPRGDIVASVFVVKKP